MENGICLTPQEKQQNIANYWIGELRKLPYQFKTVWTSLTDRTPVAAWVYSPSILRATNVKETLIYKGFKFEEENERGDWFKVSFQ